VTPKTDLEQHICKSYELVQQYEDILRVSDNPRTISLTPRY
jgi:hypothetical protein